MKYKITFIDLDGTLLDLGYGVKSVVSNANIRAVRKLSNSSIIVISTGRKMSKKIQSIGKKIKAKYYICQNGGTIFDSNFKLIKHNPISKTIVEQITEIAFENKATVAFDDKTIYGKGSWKHIFSLFSEFRPKSSKKIQILDVEKILIICHSRKKILHIKKILKTHFLSDLNISWIGKGFALEITDKNASKGIAAQFITEKEQVSLKQTVHIGDSMNDATCKGIVGNLIAMKSGSKKLKNIADTIGFGKHRGVAKAIEQFILKKPSIAIIGKYASGKTTFLKEVEKYGYSVLYTDEFFKNSYLVGQPGYKVIKQIDPNLVTKESVNKDKLRIFITQSELNRNLIESKVYEILENYLSQNHFDFVEIPNIDSPNANFRKFFSKVILISTSEEQRVINIGKKNVENLAAKLNNSLNKKEIANFDVEIKNEEWKKDGFFLTFFQNIFN